MLQEDGAVFTAAAVSSVFDLAIFLVKRYFGVELAAAVMLAPRQLPSFS